MFSRALLLFFGLLGGFEDVSDWLCVDVLVDACEEMFVDVFADVCICAEADVCDRASFPVFSSDLFPGFELFTGNRPACSA